MSKMVGASANGAATLLILPNTSTTWRPSRYGPKRTRRFPPPLPRPPVQECRRLESHPHPPHHRQRLARPESRAPGRPARRPHGLWRQPRQRGRFFRCRLAAARRQHAAAHVFPSLRWRASHRPRRASGGRQW